MAVLIMYLLGVLYMIHMHVMYISTSGFRNFIWLVSGVLPLVVQDLVLDLMHQVQGIHSHPFAFFFCLLNGFSSKFS